MQAIGLFDTVICWCRQAAAPLQRGLPGPQAGPPSAQLEGGDRLADATGVQHSALRRPLDIVEVLHLAVRPRAHRQLFDFCREFRL